MESKFYTTESTAKLPDWIKCGLGDDVYVCEEKNATFGGKEGVCPEQMPDLSKHSSFMAETLRANP
jgi:creatine kinase